MKKTFFKLLFLTLTLSSLTAQADPRFYYLKALKNRATATESIPGGLLLEGRRVAEEYFDQKLDHNNPSDTRTFKQRFYVDSRYAADKNAAVLLYVCGESACSGQELSRVFAKHAASLKAHMVAIEHRYYGRSTPFTALTADNLKYLSSQYALKDLAIIQSYLMQKRGLDGKWIAIGGSYPGALAAFYRQKYPEMVVGALASSGPVIARENFEAYDYHVAITAGSACMKKTQAAVAQVESSLNDPAALEQLKKKFGASMIRDKVDFLYFLADTVAAAVQYGYRDRYCSAMEASSTPLDTYAAFAKNLYYNDWGVNPEYGNPQGAETVNIDPDTDVGFRQWYYQSCREFGYWQTAYHDPAFAMRSQLINLEYHRKLCERLYGFRSEAQDVATNRYYFDQLLDGKTTNILFTNGSQDPWSRLGLTPEAFPQLPAGLNAMLISGSAHCDDLVSSASAALKKAQSLFLDLAKTWLK